jgi:hypothetical protein
MASYDFYKSKSTGSVIPSLKPGSNWFFVKMDFTVWNMATADTLKLFKTKNHWVVLNGLYRVATASTDATSFDIGTTAGAKDLSVEIPVDSVSDTWVRFDAGDDDAPVFLDADGYIYAECLDADITTGVTDLLFEFMIPNTSVGSMTSNEG